MNTRKEVEELEEALKLHNEQIKITENGSDKKSRFRTKPQPERQVEPVKPTIPMKHSPSRSVLPPGSNSRNQPNVSTVASHHKRNLTLAIEGEHPPEI